MKIFVATRNADNIEGRGPDIPIAHFTLEDEARKAAKGQGVMGQGDGKVETVILYDTFDEYLQHDTDVKQRALNKLTADERKALGY